MAGLASLISEFLGIQTAPIEYTEAGRRHSVKIGGQVDIEVEDIVSPLAPDGPSPQLTNLHHPSNSTLTVAKATASRISAFGLDISSAGKNGFSAPFTWSA
jgi:hypothetical protein